MTNFDKSQHVSQLSHHHYYPNRANREFDHLSQDKCDLPTDLIGFYLILRPLYVIDNDKFALLTNPGKLIQKFFRNFSFRGCDTDGFLKNLSSIFFEISISGA